MSSEVRHIFGGPTGQREVNVVAEREAMTLLEEIRAGEVVGFAIARVHHNNLASWQYAGFVGGYGMIGALEHVKARIMALIHDD